MSDNLLFPHDKVRPIQEEFMQAIDEAIKNKQHVIVHAPTGLGKTAATLAPALTNALEKNLTVFFLTSRHTQHIIAVKTLQDIKKRYDKKFTVGDLIGKKHMCIHPGVEKMGSGEFLEYCKEHRKNNTCEFYNKTKNKSGQSTPEAQLFVQEREPLTPIPAENIIAEAREQELCPYELAMSLASKSNVIISDYFYLFHPHIRPSFFQKLGKDLDRSILIIDEGHNLPNRIRELMTQKISTKTLNWAHTEAKKHGLEDEASLILKLTEVLENLSKESREDEALIPTDYFVKKVNEMMDYDELAETLFVAGETVRKETQKSFIAPIAAFLFDWQGKDEGFARIPTRDKYMATLTRRFLDPSQLSEEVIKGAHTTILMSGTLRPTDMYRDLLGFPKGTIEKEFKSPFPAKNKLALIVPETTTKYTERNPEQYKKIAERCAEFVNTIPGNSAIFFPSYRILEDVNSFFERLCKKTTFMEQPNMGKQEKAEFLERFKTYEKTGAVILGVANGSFSEGIDLPGDLLKAVIVVGLPLTKPNLETKELIAYYDRKFGRGWEYGYIFPAFTKCLQSAGRCIRSETDRGAIIFLDERFTWPTYYKNFPSSWDIKITKMPQARLKEFFNVT